MFHQNYDGDKLCKRLTLYKIGIFHNGQKIGLKWGLDCSIRRTRINLASMV